MLIFDVVVVVDVVGTSVDAFVVVVDAFVVVDVINIIYFVVVVVIFVVYTFNMPTSCHDKNIDHFSLQIF